MRSTARFVRVVVGLVVVLGAASGRAAPAAEYRTIKVAGGEVRGVVREGIASFKAIPFAAPPVGELRWKAPQPVVPWEGVRDALKFAPAPMQPPAMAIMLGGTNETSEDCLYLNVWTGAKDAAERRPVMVWIYGGAFRMGATSLPIMDGTALAKRGVVLVSIAYRVGPFGFLAHPELSAESGGKGSGNYGIQDQIAALRWVKENIGQFGGDASKVTIFGESAGAISVSILAQAPAARGLFQRAISQSGGSMAPAKTAAGQHGVLTPSPALAEEAGKSFLAALGAADIQAARRLSAEAVQKTQLEPCWPVADGTTVFADPIGVYEGGRFNDTPILIGTNSDEGAMFALRTWTPAAFEKTVREQFPQAADEILAAYPHATSAEAIRAGHDVIRETVFAWPTWEWANLQSRYGKGKPFVYYFDHGPKPGEVTHAADVPYVFGNYGGLILAVSPTPQNLAMSDTMMSYWVNFATKGDPNGPGLPEWPAFDRTTTKTMLLRQPVKAGPIPNVEKLKAFDGYYARLRGER